MNRSPAPALFDDALIEAARGAAQNAYAPYSQFSVGAAVRLADGEIITGANMENASYGLSLCAEAVAIASANTAGRMADITAIAIIGGKEDGTSLPSPTLPCGRCRQIIWETANLSNRDIDIHCAALFGEEKARFKASDLLPHAFSAKAFSPETNVAKGPDHVDSL